MMKLFFAQQHSAFAKQFDNVGVRVEHVLAGQGRQSSFFRKPAMIIDRRYLRRGMRRAVFRPAAILWLQKTVEEVSQRELTLQKSHFAKILVRHSSLLHPQRLRDWPAKSRESSSRWQWLLCLSTRHSRSEIGRKQLCRRALDIPLRLRRGRSALQYSKRQAFAPRIP